MASTRLTNVMRDRIVTAALQHRFDKPSAKLAATEETLIAEVRRGLHGKAAIGQMDALPEGWMPLSSVARVYFDSSRGTIKLRTAHPFRHPHNAPFEIAAKDLPKRLVERLDRHKANKAALVVEQEKLRRELRGALGSFATLESLLKRWPELEPFTKGIERATGNAIAVPIADLNNALGIAA